MLTPTAPRQPAPILARGAMRLRLCIGPNAFGNALGSSIASANWGGGGQQYSALEATQDLNRELARFDRQAPPGVYDDGMSLIYANRADRTVSFEGLRASDFSDAVNELNAYNRETVASASAHGVNLRPTNANAYQLGLVDMSGVYLNGSGEANYSNNPMGGFEEMVGSLGANADESFKTRVNGGIKAGLGAVGAIASAPIVFTPFGATSEAYSLSMYKSGVDELGTGAYSQSPISKAVQWSFPSFTTQEADMVDGLLGLGTGLWGVRNALVANSAVPHGFASADEFSQFGSNMRAGLGRAGYENAEPILQGSAITGKSFKTGQPFDAGRVSDFDIGLADPSMLAQAKELGIGLRSGGTRTGPLTERDLRALGVLDLSNQMGQQAGREVNFMIYNNPATAIQRAPSVILPGRK
jgi:hypothetical protein